MKKLLTLAMVLAFAMVTGQAFAEQSVSGYFRVQGISKTATLQKDASMNEFVDQRLRLKYTNKLSDDVSFVYYGEVDTPWGKAGGGQEGADGVNIETKNVYATFKAGGAKFTAGVQTFADSYDGLVYFQDVAGLRADLDVSGADLSLLWAKRTEGSNTVNDDTDFLALTYKRDALTFTAYDFVSGNGDAGDRADEFMVGAKFNYGAGDVFGLYNFGKNNTGTDVSAFAAGATYKAEGVGNFRALYVSAADDATDDGTLNVATGGFALYNDGLSIMTYDVFVNSGGSYALATESIKAGYGLMALSFSNKMDLDGGMYVNYAAGYFMLADDAPKGGTLGKAGGTDLGAELALGVGKKFDKADLSLRANYAMLGSAMDGATLDGTTGAIKAGTSDPDDIMTVIAMLNIGF